MKYPLNSIIKIEKGTDSQSSVTSPTLTYTDHMITYANVYVRSGSVKYGESEELLFTTEFTLRSNSKSREINNKYRIIYNDQKYKIIEIIEIENRRGIKIIAEHYGE